jgi:hypothetical protein
MLADFSFDYTAFYEKLLNASRVGFQSLKDRHRNETFYCFAYYSHGSYSFLYSAASTEEGLTRVAQNYIDEYPQWYSKATLDEMRVDLRHNIADSPLMADMPLISPLFEEICELAYARHIRLHEIWSQVADAHGYDEAFDLIEPHQQQFLETSISALRRLDKEGMFGVGGVREHVVLNFLTGDQSEYEMLTNAAAVNPPHIVERYKTELQAGWAMSKVIDSRQASDNK